MSPLHPPLEPAPATDGSPRISGASGGRALGRGLLLALLIWTLATVPVFVDETEYVIVESLGRITAVYDRTSPADSDRGLHFKLPWPLGTVRRFDRRQQLFDPPGREMFTRDRKNVTVSGYLCWMIAPPRGDERQLADRPVVKFYRGLGSSSVAEARLDARLRSTLPTEFGRIELSKLLSVRQSDQGPEGASPLEAIAAQALADLRQGDGEGSLRDRLGIELVDLRIKRINLPEGNRLAVYERMRTERERIAERYRSAGLAEKSRIESQARRQSDELLARAEADAERIRGLGEAEAIRILNAAHAQDPEFYEFQRTLASYGKILNERTTLILSSGNRLFRLLTQGVPDSSVSGDHAPSADDRKRTKAPPDASDSEPPNDRLELLPPPDDSDRPQRKQDSTPAEGL
ncbi:MAG: protease modulator HflC [Planctomycetales bacterium]